MIEQLAPNHTAYKLAQFEFYPSSDSKAHALNVCYATLLNFISVFTTVLCAYNLDLT